MTTCGDPEVWIGVSYDPVTGNVIVSAISQDKETCEKDTQERTDDAYRKVVQINDAMGQELHTWLRCCGVPADDAVELIRKIGRSFE